MLEWLLFFMRPEKHCEKEQKFSHRFVIGKEMERGFIETWNNLR